MSGTSDVICAGILVADFFPNALDRLPRPGELLPLDSIGIYTGGCAANTAVALAKLGVTAAVAGKVGADLFGEFIIDDLGNHGLKTSGIRRSPEHETSKTIILTLAGEDRRYFHLFGANASFCADDIDMSALAGAKVLYIGGFLGMTGFDPDGLARVLGEARERGVRTVLDVIVPGPGDFAPVLQKVLPHVDVFLPNNDEAALICDETDPLKQAEAFLEMGAGTAVITRGAEGVVALSENECVQSDNFSVMYVDGSGAGDAFAAGYIAALLGGADLQKRVSVASAMGASCVREMGCSAGLFDKQQLESFLDRQPAVLAVPVDGVPRNVFDHVVWKPVVGGAAVQDAGDIRMIETSQDLPLAVETADQVAGVETPLEDFDRHLLTVRAVDAAGEVDHAHAAPGHDALEPVGPEPLPFPVVGVPAGEEIDDRCLDELVDIVFQLEIGIELRPQLGSTAALSLQEGRPASARKLQHLIQEYFGRGPKICAHCRSIGHCAGRGHCARRDR